MIKKQLYPKTGRVSNSDGSIFITEKLDGSNLCFFKQNGELYIAQRNNIFTFTEFINKEFETKNLCYKGLIEWLNNNGEHLKEVLRENSVLCGEWIAMGKLKYPELIHTFNMFAKANVDSELKLYNLYYEEYLFKFPFENEDVPEYIKIVPLVSRVTKYPSVEDLDDLYEHYTSSVGRHVEGFVINNNNSIKKYVRMKNGKVEPHKIQDKGE